MSIIVAQAPVEVDPSVVEVLKQGVVAALADETADQLAALADVVGVWCVFGLVRHNVLWLRFLFILEKGG